MVAVDISVVSVVVQAAVIVVAAVEAGTVVVNNHVLTISSTRSPTSASFRPWPSAILGGCTTLPVGLVLAGRYAD